MSVSPSYIFIFISQRLLSHITNKMYPVWTSLKISCKNDSVHVTWNVFQFSNFLQSEEELILFWGQLYVGHCKENIFKGYPEYIYISNWKAFSFFRNIKNDVFSFLFKNQMGQSVFLIIINQLANQYLSFNITQLISHS